MGQLWCVTDFWGVKAEDFIQVKGIVKKEYLLILQRHSILSGLRILLKKIIFQQDQTLF